MEVVETYQNYTEGRKLNMDFKTWIQHFKEVDRPIGDLAKDTEKDKNFPIQNDKNVIRKYLEDETPHRSLTTVLETFDNAWDYYLKDRP